MLTPSSRSYKILASKELNEITDDKEAAKACLEKAGLNDELYRRGNTKVFGTFESHPISQILKLPKLTETCFLSVSSDVLDASCTSGTLDASCNISLNHILLLRPLVPLPYLYVCPPLSSVTAATVESPPGPYYS